MKKALLALVPALALGVAALMGSAGTGAAAERNAKAATRVEGNLQPAKARTYRKRPAQVRSYVARRGGYSYSVQDVINTYGMSRGLYGSINSYRDRYVDRQTPAGPFDHGFFFDSGIAPRGGDSPYLN